MYEDGLLRFMYFSSLTLSLVSPAATIDFDNSQNISKIFNSTSESLIHQPCVTTSGRGSRRCIYARQCTAMKFEDILEVIDSLCIIDGVSIGICCPDEYRVNNGSQKANENQADDFPFSGSEKIINRQNRGCGVATKQIPKISEEKILEPKEWPWMAAIFRRGYQNTHCGGVLITEIHVLTAAHCVDGRNPGSLFVRLGEYNLSTFDETRSRDFQISEIRVHTDFDPQSYDHDIAIIKFIIPTIFTTYIWPVCMPPFGENWAGWSGVIAGWGTKSYGGPHSDVLMEVSIPIWTNDECQEKMIQSIDGTVLCAGFHDGGFDSCQGDSGGPLIVQLPNDRWIVAGIVSWGIKCGEADRPGIYTRVNSYLEWIAQNCLY